MHGRDYLRPIHKLNIASLKSRLHHIIRNQVQVETILSPQFRHNLEHLENEIILSQIIPILKQEFVVLCVSTISHGADQQGFLFRHEDYHFITQPLQWLLGAERDIQKRILTRFPLYCSSLVLKTFKFLNRLHPVDLFQLLSDAFMSELIFLTCILPAPTKQQIIFAHRHRSRPLLVERGTLLVVVCIRVVIGMADY